MENLRKRVGDLQLDKNWKRKPKEQENSEEEKPLLKVSANIKFVDTK